MSELPFAGSARVPPPVNEPIRGYLPGSAERAELKARLSSMAAEKVDIPVIIGGREIRTGKIVQAVMPHDHRHVLAGLEILAGAGRRGEAARERRGHVAAMQDLLAEDLAALDLGRPRRRSEDPQEIGRAHV